MTTNDLLAAAALVLSTFAFFATNLLAWLRWPRTTVDITGRNATVITPGSDVGGKFDEIVVAVVNRGAEAITIRSIGLAIATLPGGSKVADPSPVWDYETMRSLPNVSMPTGPEMPARIEAHDVQIWKFPNDMLGMIPGGAEVRAYADRYKAFRFWPQCGRDIVKRSVSQRTAKRLVDHVRAQPNRPDSESGV